MQDKDKGGRTVVLTHFCETHGPSVVFTTQAVPSSAIPSNISLIHLPSSKDSLQSPPQSPRLQQQLQQIPVSDNTNSGEEKKDIPASAEPAVDSSCTTCRSVPDGAGLSSKDEENPGMCYISTHNPPASTYATIRTACVRSLSCEVTPRDGPILFSSGTPDGEGQEWGVVSYVFRLSDGQARGASRMYSILVMLSDVTLLVNSFTWLAGSLKAFIIDLQSRARRFSAVPQQQQQQISSNLSNAQTNMTRSMPRDPRYRRMMRTTPLRPLIDLMNDKEFFNKLHSRFCWIIQSCVDRVGMRMYRMPHVVEDVPTFVNSGTALSLSKILNYLGNEQFQTVLFNVLVGNQLVIRSDAIELAASIAYSLSLLPPAGCNVAVQHFTQYLHSYAASILVIPRQTTIPPDLDPSGYVTIDINTMDSETSQISTFNVKGVFETTTLGQSIEKIVDENKVKEDEKLTILVEEWLTKAKAYARMRALCAANATQPHVIHSDESQANAMRAHSEAMRTDAKMRAFARALRLVHDADLRVLAFWSTGLRVTTLLKDVV